MPCSNPIQLESGSIVPCGKCLECKKRRASGWSFRLLQQFKTAQSAYFLTLTYDTDFVPITSGGFMSLRKRDIQLFFKRLRKSQGRTDVPIKYYAVGEYGGRTFRPHYHLIIFNAKLELIQPAWNLGHIHYGDVNEMSVGYTLKYMCKSSRIPLHKNDDRQKEFSLMSKGLGLNYLTKAMKHWHLSDLENRMYCNLPDGKKISMPRYYKDKIYAPEERELIAMFFSRKFQKPGKTDKERLDSYRADKMRQQYLETQNQKL